MIKTSNIELKETKTRKLKMITTKTVDTTAFKVKGKPRPKDNTVITTANYEKFLKKRKGK